MGIIRKALKLNNKEFVQMHLSIINPFLKEALTETEINILASFMSLDEDTTAGDIFNTYARKVVKNSLNKMSSGSLSNHIRSMIDKGVLDKHKLTERISIKEHIVPDYPMQGYQFKLDLNETIE